MAKRPTGSKTQGTQLRMERLGSGMPWVVYPLKCSDFFDVFFCNDSEILHLLHRIAAERPQILDVVFILGVNTITEKKL
jgi:hypothetical protein